MSQWDSWVDHALSMLTSNHLLRSTRPIFLHHSISDPTAEVDTFNRPGPWDRSSVEVAIDGPTFHQWLSELPSGDEGKCMSETNVPKKMLLFSGNDYLGLSSHPAVRKAASKAAEEHGMGPRGSALICGYTNYHRLLEVSLADLKKKEDCILCPTGFAANMAFMTALGSIVSLLSPVKKATGGDKIAIFSDELNHASIIDGIRLAERQREVKVFVYRHCDMLHLDSLLSSCTMRMKVVITDSLFSMDGDFAPLLELVELRKKHGFLLAIDDAHATLVCGENGGGAGEHFGCEKEIDICIGTLSKAVGCHGGFIASSKRWKSLIQSRGRSFIFSTTIPVPVVAASLAAISVGRREKWRRRAIWRRVQDFYSLSGFPISSPIISLVVGTEHAALSASRHVLKSGFHVTAIRPPTVSPNSCRLRITLSTVHTLDDIKKLVAALSPWITTLDNSNLHAFPKL
ncbi:2-amino-3-ketobutyrate coenzyme A ligase [Carex littledalei]|uniref:serine C-palmitoyltransferase n=1 Tax=Carex littledalei TaxID=544730 RepID=A0A833RIL3_9POAL|nr:2-amino-3-ketobutyrate coenzyme A ligase [Carex littledalei]